MKNKKRTQLKHLSSLTPRKCIAITKKRNQTFEKVQWHSSTVFLIEQIKRGSIVFSNNIIYCILMLMLNSWLHQKGPSGERANKQDGQERAQPLVMSRNDAASHAITTQVFRGYTGCFMQEKAAMHYEVPSVNICHEYLEAVLFLGTESKIRPKNSEVKVLLLICCFWKGFSFIRFCRLLIRQLKIQWIKELSFTGLRWSFFYL